MKVVAVIPARYHSTRLPGKALEEIGGVPMIVRVWERCRSVTELSRVIVATDDERIAAVVTSAGGEAVLTAAAHASGTDRVAEAVRKVPCDLVLNIQGDEPFIEPLAVAALVGACGNGDVPHAATLATPLRDAGELYSPSVVKVLPSHSGDAVYFSRYPIPFRESLWEISGARWQGRGGGTAGEPPCFKHIGIYAYRPDFLQTLTGLAPTPGEKAERLEQLRALEHGYRIRVVVTEWDSESVDTPGDLARARARAGDDE